MEEKTKLTHKTKIAGNKSLSDLSCGLCRKICGEDSQFILSDNYNELIKDLVDFPGGHEYFIKPKFIYIDEIEAEDGYYSVAIEYFGLKPREQYIRGLHIIAHSLSPGFIGLLWRYGFVLDCIEYSHSTIYEFDHISFV